MAENKTTGESTVEQVDINLDELFAAAPDADAITLPKEEKKTKNIFSKKEEQSLDFLDKEEEEVRDRDWETTHPSLCLLVQLCFRQ